MIAHDFIPAAVHPVLATVGSGLILWGLRDAWRAWKEPEAPAYEFRRLEWFAKSLRALLVGASMLGIIAGYYLEAGWLVLASIVIGLEELYETSMAVAALETIEEEELANPAKALPTAHAESFTMGHASKKRTEINFAPREVMRKRVLVLSPAHR